MIRILSTYLDQQTLLQNAEMKNSITANRATKQDYCIIIKADIDNRRLYKQLGKTMLISRTRDSKHELLG